MFTEILNKFHANESHLLPHISMFIEIWNYLTRTIDFWFIISKSMRILNGAKFFPRIDTEIQINKLFSEIYSA